MITENLKPCEDHDRTDLRIDFLRAKLPQGKEKRRYYKERGTRSREFIVHRSRARVDFSRYKLAYLLYSQHRNGRKRRSSKKGTKADTKREISIFFFIPLPIGESLPRSQTENADQTLNLFPYKSAQQKRDGNFKAHTSY